MLEIDLSEIGKRFQLDWVFKAISYSFKPGKSYAVTGPNGSGKSTLIKLISGIEHPSTGEISYKIGGTPLSADTLYQHIAFAAPYQELIEELTLREAVALHAKLRGFIDDQGVQEDLQKTELLSSSNKQIRYFSSGMKQRLKLILAFHTPSNLLLLDEPTVNLDEAGVSWYLDKINALHTTKTILVGSNDKREYAFVNEHLHISDYKP